MGVIATSRKLQAWRQPANHWKAAMTASATYRSPRQP